jgi:hypothetical protein
VVRGSRSETSDQGPVEPYRWGSGRAAPAGAGRWFERTPYALLPFPLHTCSTPPLHPTPTPPPRPGARYALPKSRRMYRELPSPSQTTTRNIIERIVANRAAFEARNARKAVTEEKYYAAKDEKGAGAFVKEV